MNLKTCCVWLGLSWFGCSIATAQTYSENESARFRLSHDLMSASASNENHPRWTPSPQSEKPRNIALAFLSSAVIPGAGQAYNGQWMKGGMMLGVEATSWVLRSTWNARGNDQYTTVKTTAHEGWSAIRYAEWLNGFSGYGGADIQIPEAVRQMNLAQPAAWSDAQRTALHVFFNDIRTAEEQSISPRTKAGFSHKLPYFGEQQYYELIGKYFQYAPGWDDYNGADDPDEDVNGVKVNASENFWAYADAHQTSQKWLRYASRLSSLILLNHVFSAIDAGISARLHNLRVQPSVSVRLEEDGTLRPIAGFSARF